MTQKSYAKHVWILSLISALMLLFIFILVNHHRDVPGRVHKDRLMLLGERSSAAERIRPVGQVTVQSSAQPAPAQPEPAKTAKAAEPASPPAASVSAAGPADGKAVYSRACIACHQAGVAGSPKFGDKAAWAPRIAGGMDTLYTSSLKGKGAMPPKGGQTALSDTEIKAAVDYMVAESK